MPSWFALSEVELVEICTKFDVEFLGNRQEHHPDEVVESGASFSDCRSTCYPFMVAANYVEEKVDAKRIRSLEGFSWCWGNC